MAKVITNANAKAISEGLQARRQSRRREPRPIVEALPRIDIADLCRWKVFPSQFEPHKARQWELPFKYPFARSLVFSLQNVEVNHITGYNQVIPLRRARTGLGGPIRPQVWFLCQCARSVRRMYLRFGSLKCRRCCNAVYASQVCSKTMRPALQAHRLRMLLELKKGLSKRNRERLKARINPITHELVSKRLNHHSILKPQGNYATRGHMPWR